LYFSCVVEEDGEVKGFVVAYVTMQISGKRVVIEHLYAPNMKVTAKVYEVVVDKLCGDMGVGRDGVYFMTYRNPESWVKYCKKIGIEVGVVSYVLKIKK